jgi:dCTP deaminase
MLDLKGIFTDSIQVPDNSTYIDVTLGDTILVEKRPHPFDSHTVKPGITKIKWIAKHLNNGSFKLKPGQFILAGLSELVSVPTDMTGFYFINSTLARCGLNHSLAIMIQPGWTGRLTLELSNSLQYHDIELSKGMPIGKIIFIKHEEAKKYDGKFKNQNEIRG